MKEILIKEEFITLTQFLKMNDFISSGGQAKYYLVDTDVYVNEELEKRRGRKLRNDDIVEVEEQQFKIVFKI